MSKSSLPFTLEVMSSFRPAKNIKSHDSLHRITSLDFDDTGLWCLSAGTDEIIQLYDCKNGTAKRTVTSKKYGCHLARFTHKNNCCVYASTKEDDTIRYLSLYDNQYIRYFKGHKNKVTGLEVSPIDDTMISAGLDRTAFIWDIRSRNYQGKLSVASPCQVAFDATGSVIAVCSQSMRTIALYDVRKLQNAAFLTIPCDLEGSWQKVEFSNNGKYIVVATDGIDHGIYDGFNGKNLAVLKGHQPLLRPLPSTSPLALSMDGRFAFGASNNNTICIWDLSASGLETSSKTITPFTVLEAPQSPALLAFSPKTMLLATADVSLNLWIPHAV